MTNPGTVDLQYLSDFCGNDTAFMTEVIETFIQTAGTLIRDINAAAQAGEWEALRRHAHQLSPSLKLMGMGTILPDFERMQRIAKAGGDPQNEIPAILQSLVEAYGMACGELSQWLAGRR